MAKYYDKQRLLALTFQEGEKVFLLRKNLKTRRLSIKLDYVRYGLFRILEKRGNSSYLLELPKGIRIHLVFHVSLLEKAAQDVPLQTIIHVEPEEEEYKVERILDKKGKGRNIKYLVKQKGYLETENTQKLVRNLTNYTELF